MSEPRPTPLEQLRNAARFVLAFYEPGQRHLDTEAWKLAEDGLRRAVAAADAALAPPPPAARPASSPAAPEKE